MEPNSSSQENLHEEEYSNQLTPEEQVQALLAEVEQWKDLATRRLAEVENIRRRSALERQEMMAYSSEHMITKMLPVLDDLHAAVESATASDDISALKTGIEMIYQKTRKIFEDSGVNVISVEAGEPFNVEFHEALMHTPSDHPEGHIIQSVQRGYLLHSKVIRHARVITSAGFLPPSKD